MELARRLFSECDNSLTNIANLSVSELREKAGIGESTAKKILASLELGVRRLEERKETTQLTTAARVYNTMAPYLYGLDKEEFWALYLNNSFGLIKRKKIATGGITEVAVDIRVIIKEAILCNSTILVVCHNHPSGRTNPSKQDDELTMSLKKACELMRIRLSDHVILGEGCYYSYREQGKI